MNVQHRTLNIEHRMIHQFDVGRSMFDVLCFLRFSDSPLHYYLSAPLVLTYI